MLVREIIDRVRNDLDDNRTVEYTDIDLLDRIRMELNDRTETGSPIDVLNEARKNLGDFETRTGVPVSLASIRAELNDTADVSYGVSITAAEIRAKLGDPADSVLGVTTAANVNADSVIHYAQWGNTGNVTGTTGNINGSVQLAASSNQLSSYAEEGIKVLKGMRPDALVNGQLSGGFQAALNLYVLARCLEGEVETGTGGYQVFYDRFTAAAAAVPPHVSDSAINQWITLGQNAILGRRPDLGICAATAALLEDFVMAQVSQSKLGGSEKHQVNLSNFNNELDTIPYHYSDTELLQYIADGQNAIKAIRDDASGMIDCFSDAVKSYAVCHALGRRFGKAAETMSLWQAHDANFKAGTAAVPYHWTNAELTALSETGGSVIAVKRPDLIGTGAESVGRMHYTVFSALERRIGKDENAAALHKVHYEQFYSDLETVPYHWTDEELTNFQNEAIQTISSLRDDMTDGLKIRSDLVPAVLFCVSSLANNIRKDAASRNLSDAQWTKLVSLTKGLPYHWTDGELLNQVHDSIRDILAKRSDARMDEMGYELNGIETEPLIGDEYPLRESFAKASEWFSAAGAISSRIGTDTGADVKYQMWMGRYNEQITGSAKR